MSNIILGTAGHIDHGKTTLIKALTGTDTDRLKEEKARGITIDLGFAHMILPSGVSIGVVDVPGHERFIKNMVAGVGGIDIVMLVVAADEGVMPQTLEHLDILKLLKVQQGFTVVTKRDLVDGDWLDMVIEDVKSHIRGTFLEKSPIISASAITGEGISEIITLIDDICHGDIRKDLRTPFRLPIDRVFTLKGIGTVVTGSLLWGSVEENDSVEIYPKGLVSRVKSLQVHDAFAAKAMAGQRVAINLPNVKVAQISRGDVVSEVGSSLSVTSAHIYCKLLMTSPLTIKNRQRVRFHVGTKESLGRVYLLDRDHLLPGDGGLLHIALEDPLVCSYKDKYILRSYSPVTTLGGGEVIYPNPKKIKRAHWEKGVDVLLRAYQGKTCEGVEGLVTTFGPDFIHLRQICRYLGRSTEQIMEAVRHLEDRGKVKLLSVGTKEIVVDVARIKDLARNAREVVKSFHERNPLFNGMAKEELRNRLGLGLGIFEPLFSLWIDENIFEIDDNIVSLKGFITGLTSKQQKIYDDILEIYLKAGANPPSISQVISEFTGEGQRNFHSILSKLIADGRLVKLSDDILLSLETIEKAREELKDHFLKHPRITVSEFRVLLGTTRKYAIPLLEYFDGEGVTRKVQGKRQPGSKINSD